MGNNDVGREFPFEDELFGEQRKTRVRMTRAGKRKHNQQWAKLIDGSAAVQLKREQEEDPYIQRWMAQEDHTHIRRNNGVLCHIWKHRENKLCFQKSTING